MVKALVISQHKLFGDLRKNPTRKITRERIQELEYALKSEKPIPTEIDANELLLCIKKTYPETKWVEFLEDHDGVMSRTGRAATKVARLYGAEDPLEKLKRRHIKTVDK